MFIFLGKKYFTRESEKRVMNTKDFNVRTGGVGNVTILASLLTDPNNEMTLD